MQNVNNPTVIGQGTTSTTTCCVNGSPGETDLIAPYYGSACTEQSLR